MFARRNHLIAVPAIVGVLLSLSSVRQFAQGPTLTIAPQNPTATVGQTVAFTASGATAPTGVSAGGQYTCVSLSDGTLRCTGRNQFGQLANGTLTDSSVLVQSSGINTASVVAAADEFGCALLRDGTGMCWGLGEKGQRGDGTFDQFTSTAVPVQGLVNATGLKGGYNHACALIADTTMRCWGSNASGQLGDPFSNDVAAPIAVRNLSNVSAISGGGSHTCAMLGDGSIWCWGNNYQGQLGNGTGVPSTTPVQVAGIANAVEVSAGWTHTCARLASGALRCWGENSAGQLGDGTTNNALSPVAVTGISNAVGLSAGWYHHSCALLADAGVRCWGVNDFGQFGNGTLTASPVPTAMNAPSVTWTSSNPAVATIDAAGRATAVAAGATTITATDASGASASTTLTVVQPRFVLTVVKAGLGSALGSVSSSPDGISCDSDCTNDYVAGTVVTLTASPALLVSGWSGCDSAQGATCTVRMDSARSVTVTFLGMPLEP